MKREELAGLIRRKMPGWTLSGDPKIPDNKNEAFTVTVVNGRTNKVVVVQNGQIIGGQG